MTASIHRIRGLAAGAAIAAIAAASIVAASAAPARAATQVSVATAGEFAQEVAAANTAVTEDYEITLSAGFTWTGGTALYSGTGSLTIIGGGNTITLGDESEALLHVQSLGAADVTIIDLTVTGGSADYVFSLQANEIAFENVHITDTDVKYAALNASATLGIELSDSSFRDITSSQGTAAVADLSAVAVEIFGSKFVNNSAAAGGHGAVVIGSTQANWIQDSLFESNSSSTTGGAVTVTGNSAIVVRSTFLDNSAAGNGGAIFVQDGNAQIFTSTFTGNSAWRGGAVWAKQYGNVDASLFSDNRAQDAGGAVYIAGDHGYIDSSVWSSTFHDNYAGADDNPGVGNGGAIFVEARDLTVHMSTFTENSAGSVGAHVALANGSLFPFGSVFADAVLNPGCWAADGVGSNGFNFDDQGSCSDFWEAIGDFGSGIDPLLGALADNDGPTHTRLPAATSPLLDWVPVSVCADFLSSSNAAWDQRELYRPEVASYDDGCDVGAVERVGSVSFTLDGLQGPIQVTIDGAYDVDTECEAVTPVSAAPAGAPAGVAFPHGLVSFCARIGIYGGTATVHVTYPSPVTHAYKVDKGWTEIPGASFDGATLTYQVKDGGPLDINPEDDADGWIIDPLAAGVSASFTG